MKGPVWFLLGLGVGALALAILALGRPGADEPSAVPAAQESAAPRPAPAPRAVSVRAPDALDTPGAAAPETAPEALGAFGEDDRFASPAVAGAIRQAYADAKGWNNAEAEDLEPMIGDTFTATLQDGRVVDLVLTEVVPGPEDPDRPAILQRRRGVTAVLSAPPEVLGTLNEFGARSATLFHPDFGRADVMLGVYPTESGGKTLEFTLN